MLIRLFLCLFLFSCGEAIIGGIAVGTVMFSKNDYHLFTSKEVWKLRREVAKEMKKSHQDPDNIKIIQEDKVVYVIGSVPSNIIKNRITNVISQHFTTAYVDELLITKEERSKIKDFFIKAKIRHKMLFTKYIRSNNYTIIVHNQKAFIFGKVKNTQEKEIIIHTLSQIEYIDDIIAYITTI